MHDLQNPTVNLTERTGCSRLQFVLRIECKKDKFVCTYSTFFTCLPIAHTSL